MTEPTLTIKGETYVLIPQKRYVALLEAAGELPEAQSFLDESIGASLRKARLAAGLTQIELAQKLKIDQSMVSHAETGKSRVGEAYVRRVLKACKLPADWVG